MNEDTHVICIGKRRESIIAGHLGLSGAELHEVSIGRGNDTLVKVQWGGHCRREEGKQREDGQDGE